jgi:hypothetical protein
MRLSTRGGMTARRAVIVLMTALGLAVLSGGVADASDDWSTGHESWNGIICNNHNRNTESYMIGSSAFAIICWTPHDSGIGYDTSIRGSVVDTSPDGYCAFNSIRYQVYINGSWSGWQYRRIALACGYRTEKRSTWWWSLHPMRSLESRACISEANGGDVVACDPEWH